MDKFTHDFGLTAATLLLFLTTLMSTVVAIWMARVQRREIDFRTKPKLGIGIASFSAKEWQSIKIDHEITNIGFSFITIRAAVFRWWPYMAEEAQLNTQCNERIPVHLAPGQSVKLTFEISEELFQRLPKGPFESIDQLISGRLIYSFHGPDEVMTTVSESLPLPS